MTTAALKCYEDQLQEYDDDAQQVEDIIGDVAGGVELLPNASDDLKAAQLENLKMRTAMIQERLSARRNELFNEWSEKFFEAFAEAFAKLKNNLISLQLSEDQLEIFKSKLDAALNLLQDKLQELNHASDKEEGEEDDKI